MGPVQVRFKMGWSQVVGIRSWQDLVTILRCVGATLQPCLEWDLSVSNVLDTAKCVPRVIEISAKAVTTTLSESFICSIFNFVFTHNKIRTKFLFGLAFWFMFCSVSLSCRQRENNHHFQAKSMWTPSHYSHMQKLNISFQNHRNWCSAVTGFTPSLWERFPRDFGCRDLLPFSHMSISEFGFW